MRTVTLSSLLKTRRLLMMLLLSLPGTVFAQALPVGSPLLDDYHRRLQLLGGVSPMVSFTVRPLSAEALGVADVFDPQGAWEGNQARFAFGRGEGYVQVLPATVAFNTNTNYPYGWNDGAMVPTRGAQVALSAGFFAKYRFLSVQVMPELVSAANRRYDDMGNMPGFGLEWYRFHGNRIDAPQYFGSGTYTRVFPGQSFLKATFGAVSFGVSSENLYWGPGIRNSLLLGNNAPGFPHVTVHTARPVVTAIGSFEGQLVGGFLSASGFPHSLTPESKHDELYAEEKGSGDRYFSGFIATYQPRWVAGLSLGFIRSFVANRTDMARNVRDYLPVLKPTVGGTVRDRYSSMFFRWAMPAAKLEFYGEYGRNLGAKSGRDFVLEPTRSRAFILGFRKLVPIATGAEDHLLVGAEATELSAGPSLDEEDSRKVLPWYTHPVVRHGYTHRGQVLGAGIGPGSNMQSVQVAWVRGLKQVGLSLERLAHNEDFFYAYVDDIRRPWVDLNWSLYGEWDVQRFLLSAQVHRSYAQNYRYAFEPGTSYWEFDGQDEPNLTLRLGVSYRF